MGDVHYTPEHIAKDCIDWFKPSGKILDPCRGEGAAMREEKPLKMLSLFSGIGGFDLAAEWAGIETVMFCERDAACRAILQKHWPNVPIVEDVKDVRGFPVDIICGGYPCQPFSQAGRKGGANDERHLWPEMYRIIRGCAPAWVVAENVANHVTIGLDAVIDDMERIGYACEAYLFPACAVSAPHERYRVFVVAHSQSIGRDDRRAPERRISETIRGTQEPVGGLCGIGRGDTGRGAWLPEPRVARVVDGVSGRVDRVKQLGNAVVPQQAYPIFKAIKEISSRVS